MKPIKLNFNKLQPHIYADLTEKGWFVQDKFLDSDLIQQLANECRYQHKKGLLKEAGIGRAEHRSVIKSVRGDEIRWLETGMSASTDLYLTAMDNLRLLLNKHLYLGLKNSENHFAVYSAGAFYQKHVDRFKDNTNRTISSVLYLNPHWKAEHGGELRLHLTDQQLDIAPIANRLVLFVSADIWHEVLPTKAERLSLTGWFKRQD